MLSARMILPVLVVAWGSWSLMVTAPLVPGVRAGLERQERELACAELLRDHAAPAELALRRLARGTCAHAGAVVSGRARARPSTLGERLGVSHKCVFGGSPV